MGIQPSDGLIPYADRGEHAEIMRLLREALPDGGRVLDCPSAVGYFSTLDTTGQFRFVAVDCIPESHYLADGPTFHQADVNRGLSFLEDQSFDAVVSIEGIEHLESPASFLRECERVLKPGGTLIVATPNIMKLASRFKFLLTGLFRQVAPLNEFVPLGAVGEGVGAGGDADRGHLHVPTYLELRFLMKDCGLRLAKVTGEGRKVLDYVLLCLAPLVAIATFLVLNRERHPEQNVVNRTEILPDLLSLPLLTDGNLILIAKKITEPAGRR